MLRRLVPFLILVASCSHGFADDLQVVRRMWEQKDYQTVLPRLIDYWNGGGKTFEVEYMIGTSECRIPGFAAYGLNMLDDALQSFKLGEEDRRRVKVQREWCQKGVKEAPGHLAPSAAPVLGQLAGPATLQGKGGYVIYSKASLPGSKLQLAPIPALELQKRLIALDDQQQALASVRNWTGSISVAPFGPFVVASQYSGPSYARATGECLQRYQAPLEKEFQMGLPKFFVTVYAVEMPQAVPRAAQRLHHVALPPGTVAYSVYDDLSIVGAGGPESCGSLAHELVHLMIRRNFGNCPPWLEEGLASEVAVVRAPRADAFTFTFSKSWRDDMLESNWRLRPTVDKLIDLDWTAYTAGSNLELHRVAAVHAMAAAFVRYLDSKGQLTPVYFAVRDQRFNKDLQGFRTYREILEEKLGKPVAAIDKDFVDWFKGQRMPD